jgi:hypothetical protein
VLDDARWHDGGMMLWVRGHWDGGTGEKVQVAIYGIADDGSSYLLGAGASSKLGRFGIEIRPFVAPCRVVAEVDAVRGNAIPVAGAPADCGDALLTRASADLSRKDVLHLNGRRGPVGGAVVVFDPATGADLVRIPVHKRSGNFSYDGKVRNMPRKVKMRAELGGMSWMGDESVTVGRGECSWHWHHHHKHGRH